MTNINHVEMLPIPIYFGTFPKTGTDEAASFDAKRIKNDPAADFDGFKKAVTPWLTELQTLVNQNPQAAAAKMEAFIEYVSTAYPERISQVVGSPFDVITGVFSKSKVARGYQFQDNAHLELCHGMNVRLDNKPDANGAFIHTTIALGGEYLFISPTKQSFLLTRVVSGKDEAGNSKDTLVIWPVGKDFHLPNAKSRPSDTGLLLSDRAQVVFEGFRRMAGQGEDSIRAIRRNAARYAQQQVQLKSQLG